MRRFLLLFAWILLLLARPAVADAQGVTWEERRTLQFSILHPSGAEALADEYARFVDGIYDEMTTLWDYHPPPPMILRLYPTMDLYYEANPLAARMPGVIAHAHTGRREISVAIPQTMGQSDEELRNNVRHELTHIIAADLSDGRLTTPWQEGIAQYVEHPSEQLEQKMRLMRQLIAEDRLLSWRALNEPGATYADPRVGYPQSFTIVAFLIQRDGMSRFRAFVEATRESSSYRGALERAYGVSPDILEREWREQLPRFVTEGYRAAGGGARLPVFDLDPAAQLVARGEFQAAVESLRGMIPAIRTNGDADTLLQAQSLLARAEIGQRAVGFATDARAALLRGDYLSARSAGAEGEQQFDTLGAEEQIELMREYQALAERGMAAERQLATASSLLRRLRVPEAREHLVAAYSTFSELGDQPRASQAEAALNLIGRAERVLVIMCLLTGVVFLLWSIRLRRYERRVALPFS
jgi:hypothetical protein